MDLRTPTECPKCGTPARFIHLLKAHVRCVLESDGSAGKVLSASRESAKEAEYECRGGHRWPAPRP